jgi:hypothetical protein
MPEKNIKNIIPESGKMKRKKFFFYSGTALLGIFAFLNIPSALLKSVRKDSSVNSAKTSLKITENPNAVKRKSRQVNNG